MKKFRYTIIIAALALFVVSCSTGGDDDDPPSGSIGSAADLAKIGTPGYPLSGSYELTADITLPPGWTPIGNGTRPFTGTFDGKGRSITITSFSSAGVDISAAPGLVTLYGSSLPSGGSIARGLFAYTENAAIKYLEITVNLSSPPFVITPTAADQAQFFGTVAAVAMNTALTNINISGGGLDVNASSTNGISLGGIVGMLLGGSSSINGCSMNGNVKASGNGSVGVGGLAGDMPGASSIINSSVSGNVQVSGGEKDVIGGLVGNVRGSIINSFVIGNVSAESDVSSSELRVGGLAGELDSESEGIVMVQIQKSYSTGTVRAKVTVATGSAIAGGIAGTSKEKSEVTDSYSTGAVTASGGDEAHAGGIVGRYRDSTYVTIARCYASGDIRAEGSTSTKNAGGIAGSAQAGAVSITNCAALSGTVSTDSGTAKRIIGSGSGFSLSNNIAHDDMSGGSWSAAANGQDGADVSIPLNTSTFETTLDEWDFGTVWKWQGGYPVLQWQP
jgi:hypothetical protein